MILKVFLVITTLSGINSKLEPKFRQNQDEALVHGLRIISLKLIENQAFSYNVITTSNGQSSRDFVDMFMRVLMSNSNIRIRQQYIKYVSELQAAKTLRRFSVIIIEAYSDFQVFLEKLTPSSFDTHGYFIVVSIYEVIKEIQDIFNEFWKRDFYNVIVIYRDTNRHIKVFTFFPFRSKTDCSNTTPVLVNEFINGTFTSGFDIILADKMQNLKQCPVRVASTKDGAPHIYAVPAPNGTLKFYGRDYELMNGLSDALNFTLNFTYTDFSGYIFENGTAIGSLEKVLKNEADLSVADWWLRLYRLKYFEAATSYISERLVFAVHLGSELSSIEKLIYPLSPISWIIFISFIFSGFLVIFITSLLSKRIQNFIIGQKVKYPYLNMAIGLFGQTQHRLPKRNFARFLLMNYLLFSLVLRNIYQGQMFELLKLNMKHAEPSSIDELIEQEYEVMLLDIFYDYIATKNFKYRLR